MKQTLLTGLFLMMFGLTSCMNPKAEAKNDTTKNVLLYNEKYRPQVHFTPPAGWMNDPNGMVYFNDEYHLFYQHYPEKSVWGPMHWGHAISKDLVHWENQPIAFYPDSLGYIFSGSAVVDWNNTSGFGTADNPPLVAFFTYHNPEIAKQNKVEVESQGIAYSTDSGRTWTKYDHNPVVTNPGIRDFRDPKVFWHAASQKWIMSLASGQEMHYYSSPDCKSWDYISCFGEGYGNHDGVWECPDLFELPVANSAESKWVQIVNINPGGPYGGSATQYFVGDFDGEKFTTNQKEALWMDHGRDNYAGVTWADAPDNKRILIGWMNNWQYAGEKPCHIWSGAATFPRELGLVKDGDLYLLTSKPIEQIENLYGQQVVLDTFKIKQNELLSDKFSFAKSPVEIKLKFDQSNNTQLGFASKYGIRLKNEKGEYLLIGYDNVNKLFYIDRTNATEVVFSDKFASVHSIPYIINTPDIEWTLLIDNSSVEFFAADGRIVATTLFYPSESFDIIELFANNGAISVENVQISELKSIWN